MALIDACFNDLNRPMLSELAYHKDVQYDSEDGHHGRNKEPEIYVELFKVG